MPIKCPKNIKISFMVLSNYYPLLKIVLSVHVKKDEIEFKTFST